MVTGIYRVDIAGLGTTYDTSAGVGIEGGLLADTKERVGGVHWGWFIGIIILALAGITQLPSVSNKLARWFLGARSKEPALVQKTNSTSDVVVTNRVVPKSVPFKPSAPQPLSVSSNVFWTGYSSTGKRNQLWLSNG